MSLFKEFQCCNSSDMILQKEITFSNDVEEHKNLNHSNIIINDEYTEISCFIKIDKNDSFVPSNKFQIKSTSCNESLNATFLSTEIPSNIESTGPTTKISSIEFSALKLEQHKTKKLFTQITKMRKYLLDNSF